MSQQKPPASSVVCNVEDDGRHVSPITSGLADQCADRSAHTLGKTSAVSAQCFCMSDLRTPAIRPCLWSFDVAAMAAHPTAYPIQIGVSKYVDHIVHWVLHGNASDYFWSFTRLSDVPSRSSLRSALSNHPVISPVPSRSTVGVIAFLVTGSTLLNSCQLTLRSSTVCQSFINNNNNNTYSSIACLT